MVTQVYFGKDHFVMTLYWESIYNKQYVSFLEVPVKNKY